MMPKDKVQNSKFKTQSSIFKGLNYDYRWCL